ncbi:MAG: hypothetical protein P8R42_30020 [Candidatus Binatia bacterium]|nr:hypothetical protein [Candidatus Binatia bacterium]
MAEAEKQVESSATASEMAVRAADGPGCDACGTNMQPLGHCKYLCRMCGFMRTCIDTV